MQNTSTALQAAIEAQSATVKPKVVVEWNYNQFADDVAVTNPSGWYARWWKRNSRNYRDIVLSQTPRVTERLDTINLTNRNPGGDRSTWNGRVEGYITALYTETYTFYATSDDGVRVWFDDVLVINKWKNQAARTYTFKKQLKAGHRYKIRIDHYEYTGRERLRFEWSSTSQPREDVGNVDGDEFEFPSRANYYDVTSIAQARRPTSGLPYAIADGSRVSNSSQKYYVSADERPYQIWATPYANTKRAKPQIVYDKQYRVNKLHLTFERSWVIPTVNIYITTNGETWTLVGNNKTPDSKGRIVLYRQANGSWTATRNLDNAATNIMGIRCVFVGLSKSNTRGFMIEMSCRYEQDLTEDVVDFNINNTREEIDISLPIGHVLSSNCEVSLANDTGRYDPHNASSDLFGLIDQDAVVELSVGYDTTPHGGNGFQYLKQGVFYVESWSIATDNIKATMNCRDYSRYFQETKMPNCFYMNRTPQYIVTDILARIGYNNIEFDLNNTERAIPYLWYKEDTSVWDALVEIAKSEQATFFWDVSGTLRWQTRDFMYNQVTQWQIKHDKDLVSLQHNFEVYSNSVTVRYKKYEPNTNGNQPVPSMLWKASDNVSLRSVPLNKDFEVGDTIIRLDKASASIFPTSGIVNIEGEYIRYEGKGSNYLKVKERGLLGSQEKDHRVGIGSKHVENHHTHRNPTSWVNHSGIKVCDGRLWLWNGQGNRNRHRDRWKMRLRGIHRDAYKVYGTKIRFEQPTSPPYAPCDPFKRNNGMWHTMGGFVINYQGGGNGVYFELVTRHWTESYETHIGNVRCYIMKNNVRWGRPTTPEGISGYDFEIIPGKDYQLDITYSKANNLYTVFVNGTTVTSFQDSTFRSGLWGPFVRGSTVASFEYTYAANPDGEPNIELDRFYDRINGGWISGYPGRYRDLNEKHKWFFQEYEPQVHEVREFDVDYQLFPALNGVPYTTNDWESEVFLKRHNPFGMFFIIENTSRNTATLNGDDFTIVDGEGIGQQLFVYGQALVEQEEKSIKVRNDASVRRHGLHEFEIQNPWIQREEQAQDIADFIDNRWASPVDVVTVKMVPNPAIEVGDLVSIHYPDRSFDQLTHKYFVTGHSLTFDKGLSAQLTLRRKV